MGKPPRPSHRFIVTPFPALSPAPREGGRSHDAAPFKNPSGGPRDLLAAVVTPIVTTAGDFPGWSAGSGEKAHHQHLVPYLISPGE